MFRRYKLKNFDFLLVLLVIALNVIGILAIGSAKQSEQSKQILGMAVGLIAMLVIAFLDYSRLLKLAWIGYLFVIVTLILVHFFGRSANGAARWLDLGFFELQPSETAKILLILFYAQYIMKHKETISSLKTIISMLVLLSPPLLLIYRQPDLSTTIMIALLFCVLLFMGGLSYKIIFGVLAIAVPLFVIFLTLVLQPDQTLLKDYQQTRILAWLNPAEYSTSEGYQQENSKMAIGSGELFGKGLNNNEISSVKNGNFISEPQTDFIFAIVGEELGFAGGCLVVGLLFLITLECLMIARKAKDIAGMLIATGMATVIGFQSFMNIGVATGIVPNTGIPLPFVSYGLTSLVSLYIGMGFVLNVRLQCVRKFSN